jgi:hypothetical protein
MKQTIGQYQFHDAFESIRPGNFSHEGLDALFNFLESLEDDTGEEMELDVIAICCDFSEMTLKEINQDYSRDYEDIDEAIEALNDETMVIPVADDRVILQAF